MLAENPVQSLPEYARDAQPGYKIPPTQTQISNGVIPLDSLPAQWWNTLWGDITKQERNTVTALNTIITEVNNVLQEYGVTPSESSTTQLNLAIKNAFDSFKDAVVGTMTDLETTVKDTVVGAINSLFTERGLLTDLTTADKNTVVGAINEVDSDLDTHMTDTNNPHRVTKAQVGLSDVVNKPMDSEVTRDSENYISNGAVAAAINEVDSDLDTHMTDTNNPHRVTKAQVGLSDVVNKPMDSEVTRDSENYISSGAVAAAITSAGAVPLPATTAPLGASSTGIVGTSNTYARGDHRHPYPDQANVSRIAYILGVGTAPTVGRLTVISWSVGDAGSKSFSYFTKDGIRASATLTVTHDSYDHGYATRYLQCTATSLLVIVGSAVLVLPKGVSTDMGQFVSSDMMSITIFAAL